MKVVNPSKHFFNIEFYDWAYLFRVRLTSDLFVGFSASCADLPVLNPWLLAWKVASCVLLCILPGIMLSSVRSGWVPLSIRIVPSFLGLESLQLIVNPRLTFSQGHRSSQSVP